LREKRDLAVKTRSERMEIQREIKEEEKALNDLDLNSQTLQRDRDKHANVLNERERKQDECRRLKRKDNKSKRTIERLL
jgi:hypothetical protein